MTANPQTELSQIPATRSVLEPSSLSVFRAQANSLLERLLVFAAPLLIAVSRKKKKSSRRQAKRKQRKSVKRAKARPARRVAVKKPARRARVTTKRSRHNQLRGKTAPPSPKIAEEEEPLPPLVPPIGRAILLVPKDATYVESLHPTFRWLSVGGAAKYEVQWGEDQALATKYATISLATESTVPVEKPLRVDAVYYWRVRGGNDAGWGPWSPISSFRVLEETP